MCWRCFPSQKRKFLDGLSPPHSLPILSIQLVKCQSSHFSYSMLSAFLIFSNILLYCILSYFNSFFIYREYISIYYNLFSRIFLFTIFITTYTLYIIILLIIIILYISYCLLLIWLCVIIYNYYKLFPLFILLYSYYIIIYMYNMNQHHMISRNVSIEKDPKAMI